MINTREYNGQWKIPNSDNWCDGTLTYSSEFGGELKLFGNLKTHFFDHSAKDIIIGETNEGNVTLLNSYHRNTSSGYGITTQKYQPSIIFDGIHVLKESELCFNSVIFKAHNLYQWLDISGINLDNKRYDCKHYSIDYKSHSNIAFNFGKKNNGYISFDAPLTTNGDNNKVELYEEAYIHLHYAEPTNYDSILTDVSKFVNFITLTTYEQSFPISINLLDENETKNKEEGKPYKLIKCIYKHSRYSKKHKIRDSWYHLFSYQDISKMFPSLINEWYVLHDEMESEILLLINFFRNKYLFSEERFMECIRAIESFHRVRHKNEKLPKEKYNALVRQVKNNSKLSGEDLDWLNAKLMGNEPSLGIRLDELITKYKNKYIIDNITQQVCRDAKNSRNYYTHFSKSAKRKALQGEELSNLTRKLRGLLISAILTELGVESNLFIEKLDYHLN